MSIPGGVDCPGAELVPRFSSREVAADAVVVNCAGRTRSIIGAQSLINAGVPNRVMALKDGTMGWKLAGFDLETGRRGMRPHRAPSAREAQEAASASPHAQASDVIDDATLARQGEPDQPPSRRAEPEEDAAGDLRRLGAPGAARAGDGRYRADADARLVLVDDDGVRARMTASWLLQLGWPDVCVLDAMRARSALRRGRNRPRSWASTR